MQAFQSDLGTSFHLVSGRGGKTIKRVNPKSIEISDEIEKRPKWGLLSIFLFVKGSKLVGIESSFVVLNISSFEPPLKPD